MSILTPEEIENIKDWLQEAGDIALRHFGKTEWFIKDDNTPVSQAELDIESFLSEKLDRHFPTFNIISEENINRNIAGNMVWALDPIDGTKSYLGRLPFWGISLGLLDSGKPAAGFFYMPATQDLYWGCNGQGGFWNGNLLEARNDVDFEDPLMFLAVPSNAHLNYDIHYPRLRTFGSTAAHLALLARGEAVGVLTRRVNIWDVAGLLPILEQLDMCCQYISGESFDTGILLDGRKTPEALLAAPGTYREKLRCLIEIRRNNKTD